MRFVILQVMIFFMTSVAVAQTPYSTLNDPKHPEQKMLVGAITHYILQNDPAFSWYGINSKGYIPSTQLLNTIEAFKDSIQYVVFAGTWCEDSQFIIPRFFSLLEKGRVADNHVSFFAVDRHKKIPGNIAAAFKITNVPTIIAMKSGVEIGRVVEYGKKGKWDEELGGLLR